MTGLRALIITAVFPIFCLSVTPGCSKSSSPPPVPFPPQITSDIYTSDTFYPGDGALLAGTTNARLGGDPKTWSVLAGTINMNNSGTEASAYAYADALDGDGAAVATIATGCQEGTIEFTFVSQPAPGGDRGSRSVRTLPGWARPGSWAPTGRNTSS